MRRHIILVNKHGRPSTKGVYKALGGDTELLIKSSIFDGYVHRQNGVKKKLKGLTEPDCKNSIVVRWGSKCPIVTDENTIVYNKIESTERSNNKPLCRKILQDAGIAVPKTYFPDSDFSDAVYPLVSRRAHHGRGLGIEMARNVDDVRRLIRAGFAYFSEVYKKQREVRVHCFNNKVLSVMEKHPPADKTKIAWNRHGGEPFTLLERKDWPMEACILALDGVSEVGLDFGAVDILLDAGEGQKPAVICEINTAPTLNSSNYNTERYTMAFAWLFASDKRRPKWNYKLFKKVESLALKRFQMALDFEIPEEFRLK